MTRDREAYRALLDRMQQAFGAFAMAAIGISDADAQAALDTVRSAEAVGWALDPTAYRDALYDGRLGKQAELIGLFIQTRKVLDGLYPKDAEMRKMAHAALAAEKG